MTLSARKAVPIILAIATVVSTACQDTTEPVVSRPSFHLLPPPAGGYYQWCRRWPQGGTAVRWSDELQWTTGPCAVQVSSSPGTMMSATNPQTMTFQFTGPVLNVVIQTNGAFPLPCPTVTLTAMAYNGETLVDSASFEEGCSARTGDHYHNAGPITKLVITPPEPMPSTGAQFLVHYYVPCPQTGDPVFDDLGIRQQLNLEWSRSLGDNLERAGWIYQDTQTGEYVVWTDMVSRPDRCGVDMPNTPPPMAGKIPVRSWHTHIIEQGQPVGTNCQGELPLRRADNGPSPDVDIPWVQGSGLRSIIMDHDEVFTIESDGAFLTHPWAEGCRAWSAV